MTLGYFVENVPDLRRLALNHLLRAPNGVDVAEFLQPTDDEWLEQHECHFLWQPALMELQLRSDDDDRTARIIDAFAEQVLTETSALALKHVTERLQRTVASTSYGAAMTTVVEKSIYR